MLTGPRRRFAPLLAAAGLAAGCAQSGSLAPRPMMVGTLKTEVVRLEQEKERYRQRVAELEAANVRVADELDQERTFSEDLEARLADARALLDRRGLASDPSAHDSPPAPPIADWDNSPPTSRTQPASDPQRPARKAPFAQIGGSISAPLSDEDAPDSADSQRSPSYSPSPPPARSTPGPQSRSEPPVRWLPVADSAGIPPATR